MPSKMRRISVISYIITEIITVMKIEIVAIEERMSARCPNFVEAKNCSPLQRWRRRQEG